MSRARNLHSALGDLGVLARVSSQTPNASLATVVLASFFPNPERQPRNRRPGGRFFPNPNASLASVVPASFFRKSRTPASRPSSRREFLSSSPLQQRRQDVAPRLREHVVAALEEAAQLGRLVSIEVLGGARP